MAVIVLMIIGVVISHIGLFVLASGVRGGLESLTLMIYGIPILGAGVIIFAVAGIVWLCEHLSWH